jgi:hypothetical protein
MLVADTIRLYGQRFWRSLALGIPPAILLPVLLSGRDYALWVAMMATVGAFLMSLSYVGACVLAAKLPFDRRAFVAVALGTAIFAPFPFLMYLVVLPAVAWLALVGLAVPALLVERLGVRAALVRGVELARADYVHALGSLATLVIVCVLSIGVLLFLLRETGEQSIRIAAFLSIVVVSPLVFLGSALLYFDQAARLKSRFRRKRSRNADLHHALQPDRPGRADAEVEP